MSGSAAEEASWLEAVDFLMAWLITGPADECTAGLKNSICFFVELRLDLVRCGEVNQFVIVRL